MSSWAHITMVVFVVLGFFLALHAAVLAVLQLGDRWAKPKKEVDNPQEESGISISVIPRNPQVTELEKRLKTVEATVAILLDRVHSLENPTVHTRTRILGPSVPSGSTSEKGKGKLHAEVKKEVPKLIPSKTQEAAPSKSSASKHQASPQEAQNKTTAIPLPTIKASSSGTSTGTKATETRIRQRGPSSEKVKEE